MIMKQYFNERLQCPTFLQTPLELHFFFINTFLITVNYFNIYDFVNTNEHITSGVINNSVRTSNLVGP